MLQFAQIFITLYFIAKYLIKNMHLLHRSPSLLIALSILLFLSSCREPKELEYRDFKNLSTENLGFSSSTIKVDLIYYNPNNFGLQLKRTDLDVFINGNLLGHTAQDYQISIPRRGEFTLPLKIDVDMKNAYKNAFPALFGKEVMVKITGKVKVGKANVFKSFNVNYEGKQKFSL
jgi:LEA14-like dessication related protein